MPLPRLPARGLLLLLLALVFLPALAAQESSWDGNAAVVRKGEFDSPGLFAASDSFPQGTLLRVENPQNSKAVQVTVVDRINGRGNVFLLLSEQAAAVLGLSPSEVIRVKARVLIASIDSARAGSREPAASPDPDVNPAAAVAALPEAAAAKSEATEAPAEAAAAAAEPVAAVGAPAPEPPAEAPPRGAPLGGGDAPRRDCPRGFHCHGLRPRSPA
jgi:rare lipoprotein A (peptidoglycan hydrolase)